MVKKKILNFILEKKNMGDNGLLKEILDSLNDVDTINLFAEANGLTGDTDVENRVRELEWEEHINS